MMALVMVLAILGMAGAPYASAADTKQRRLLPRRHVVPVEIYAHARNTFTNVRLEPSELEVELDGVTVEIEELCEASDEDGEPTESAENPLCREQRGPIVVWVNEGHVDSVLGAEEMEWLAGYVAEAPRDQPVGLFTFDGAARIRHGFDDDPSSLPVAIEGITHAEGDASQGEPSASRRDAAWNDVQTGSQLQELASLRSTVRALSAVGGHKVLFYLGDGFDQDEGARDETSSGLLDTGGGAERADASVRDQLVSLVQDANAHRVTICAFGDAPAPAPTQRVNLNELQERGAFLNMLTAATGGRLVSLSEQVGEVARELRRPATVVLRPGGGWKSGRYYRLSARSQKEGVVLRYREGVPNAGPIERMVDRTVAAAVLGLTKNNHNIEIDVGQPRVNHDGTAAVAMSIEVPLAEVVITPEGEHHSGALRLFVATCPDSLTCDVSAREYPLNLSNQELLVSVGHSLRIAHSLALTPGAHRIGVGVQDANADTASTAWTEVVVEDPAQ